MATDSDAQFKPGASASLSSLRSLVILSIALPVVVYAAVGIYRWQQIRAEAEVRIDRSLRIAHEHALRVLDTNEAMLGRVLDTLGNEEMPGLRQREKELHDWLRAATLNKPQVQSIIVHGPNGEPLVSDVRFPMPQVDLSDRDYVRHHQSVRGQLYVSGLIVGRTNGQTVFTMSRGRNAPDGRFLGLVSMNLLPSYFHDFYKDLVADEPGLAVNMLREDGSIFTRWPALQNSPASLSPDSPVMKLIRSGQIAGQTLGVSSVDGRERLLSYHKVGDYPIYLGTGMDLTEVRKRWFEEMGWLAAFGLPPLVGLFLAARVGLRRTRDALASAERLNQETIARRRVEEALVQAQKLEALGRLTGGVAHDFNNALMVISNNLFLLKRKHPTADGPQVESIARAVDSATKLTRQLLAFSRKQALVPEYVVLQDKLPTLQDLLGPVLGSQVHLSLDAAPGTLPILVDAAEFELALINLAINARDAMPSGGSFRITAHNATMHEQPALLTGQMVVVEVIDTGTGIAPDLLDKVFEPFFTTKPVGEGTGLGLSQVYGLCQRAGGVATVHSELGAGATVRLFFPATQKRPEGETSAKPEQRRHLGKNILLVEDNDDVAAALQPVLEAMGCTVTRLDRAALARDWLARQDKLPDLVLSDVVMPGDMDGVALAQHVRQRFPQLRLILMTGYAQQLESISKMGFEILPKPCSPDMLADAILRTPAA